MLKKTLMMALVAATIQMNAADKPITKIETSKKVVALTFDDGPKAAVLPSMLDLCKKEKVKVTLFMCGKFITQSPDLVRRAIKEGHEIGNHTMTHKNLAKVSNEVVLEEIDGMQALMTKMYSYTPKVFRAPFLKHNANVWKCLNKHNLPSINASIGTGDYKKTNTAAMTTEKATSKAHPGAIILMHEMPETLKALPQIIASYKEKGYSFVTVSELLQEDKKL